MFGSAVARKELNICLRCEYLLFRASHPYSIYRSSRLRRFTTTSRRIESENLSNNGGTANISINPERSYESRAALRDDLAPPDRANRILQTDSLRLNIPDDGLEQKFGERRNDRRSNVRYLAKSQYTDQSGTEGIHEVPIKEDPLQDLFRENYKYPAFRHPDVTSDRVELGVDRLGEPATIRVLPEKRDRARRTRENLPARIEEEGSKSRRKREAPTSFDEIAKALDLENEGAAGAAESMNNLETIRKAFQDTNNQFDGPTQAECLKLARLLDNGFTAAQLSGYRKLAKAMKHTEQNRLDAFTTNDRYSISRWYVGTCEWPKQSLRRLDPKICEHEQNVYAVLSSPTLDANGIPKQNSKQKLINSILSRHWGVRPLEERSREGSVSMNIGKNWLALLLGQKEQVFYKVSEIFGVKTIISEEHGLVRISGSYDACVDAVRTIVNCMSSAQVEQIDLFATPSTQAITSIQRNFLLDVIKHQEFWSEVEDQTSTRIEPVDMRKTGTHTKIDVYHLPTDTKSLAGVKTRVFQLQKLLSLRPLAWSSFPQPGVTKASLVPISNSPSMTLMERHLDWYRWRDRRPLEIGYTDVPSIVNQGGIIFDKLMAFWSNRSIESVRTAHGEFSRNKYWARRPQTLLTATLGQLGHAMAPIERDAIQKRLDHEASTSEPKDCGLSRVKYTESVFRHRRIISPAIPHLFSLLNTSIQDQSTLSNHFKIILAPRIVLSTTSVDIDQIPVLELEANIDEASKTTKLQSVRLLIDRQYVDLALPRQNSDVRFDAETFMLGAVDSFDPAILQFFEMSKLDIWGAGHFETPPKLILTVPKAACQLMNQLESLATSSMTSSTGLVGEPVQSNPLEKGDPSVTTTGSITKGMDVKHSSTSLSRMSHPVVDSISDQIEEDDLIGESVSRVDQGLRTASSNEAETKRSTDLQDPTTVPIESPEDHNVDQATNKGNQDINTEGHSIQVEYVFDSLMICSKLQSLYQGFPLSSTTIEAGQVGGKREEVKFEIPGIADELMNVRGKDIDQKREKMFKSYFMTFFGTISELISRLPR